MKIAVVHEFLLKMGGAENTLRAIMQVYPNADMFFLNADEDIFHKNFAFVKNQHYQTSWLGKLPKCLRRLSRLFVGAYPQMVEAFDFSEYDLVICSSNSFGHGVCTSVQTPVVCYYHSACRYLWDWKNEYEKENKLRGIKGFLAKLLFFKQRQWDFLASRRVDVALANSINVQKRLRKYYKLESEVLYPPIEMLEVDEKLFEKNEREDFFLIASTLTPYKNIELAVRVFNANGRRLVVAGGGADMRRLKELSKPNIEFLGFVDRSKLVDLMSKAYAFVFPGEEDFGMAPVEAMGFGCPVIAFKKGGLLETVIDQETGVFFQENTQASLQNAIVEFDRIYPELKLSDCRRAASKFDKKIFQEKLKNIIDKTLQNV